MKVRQAKLSLLVVCLLPFCACTSKEFTSAKPLEKAPEQTAKSDRITFPADSPKLSQIHSEDVVTAAVPANEVNSPGKIEANPNRLSHVIAPLSGRVVQVLVRIGDAVKQGDPVLVMECPDLDTAIAAHAQAAASVTQAKIALAKAKSDYERTKTLVDKGAVAEKELIATQSVVAQSEPAIAQAEALTSQALRRLQILGVQPGAVGQRLTVRAPIAGKVLEIGVTASEFKNDTSASLLTIADLSSVWVSSDVQESHIGLVRKGEQVEISLSAYPNEKFSGRVTQIADVEDPTTRTIKVRSELPNPNGRLRPEMFAQIRLVGEARQMPVVPAAAILQADGKSVVYRELSKGVFEAVFVTTGGKAGDKIAIASGLSKGDRVVTDGVMLLRSY